MLDIPEKEARKIAEKYGYDQVIIHGRKFNEDVTALPIGESLVTYGKTKKHAVIVHRIGEFLKERVFASNWSV